MGTKTTTHQGSVDDTYLRSTAFLLGEVKRRSHALLRLPPGGSVLDVGCGSGIDTVALGRLVGPGGRVMGVDVDGVLCEQAKQRAEAEGVAAWVSHEMGDATQLRFPSASFDACRSERLFQHMSLPNRALAEMVRVTRRGGFVVVVDTDWGTLSVDHPEIDLERRMARTLAERRLGNGYAGRQLHRLLRLQSVDEITLELHPVAITSQAFARSLAQWDAVERDALESGALTAEELRRWRRGLDDADRKGVFFASATLFVATGRVP